MTVSQMIMPDVVTVGDREFTLSKIPAFTAKPVYNEIVQLVREYGDIGRTMLSDDSMKAVFRHVAVKGADGEKTLLDSIAAVERAFPSLSEFYEVLLKMEDYNFGFLVDGTLRSLLEVRGGAEAESAS